MNWGLTAFSFFILVHHFSRRFMDSAGMAGKGGCQNCFGKILLCFKVRPLIFGGIDFFQSQISVILIDNF